jgi:hypothetical protein
MEDQNLYLTDATFIIASCWCLRLLITAGTGCCTRSGSSANHDGLEAVLEKSKPPNQIAAELKPLPIRMSCGLRMIVENPGGNFLMTNLCSKVDNPVRLQISW